ncbi:thy-1 membrane glycoprotein [Narcine bancroftii]|uniref:thy-1 membrane glycoprotein n=1 Tax=Narcine bancroftii TaxID=1343680 RepID=UPI003831F4F9
MNPLLILSVLAVLPLMEGQQITKLMACITKTNDLSLLCFYTKISEINYEWSLLKENNQTLVLASTIQPNKVSPTLKNRVKITLTDVQLKATLNGFGTSIDGKYTCHLRFKTEPMQEFNKTISVLKATVPKCGASGLLPNTSWMLCLLLLFPVLQALDVFPCGNEN